METSLEIDLSAEQNAGIKRNERASHTEQRQRDSFAQDQSTRVPKHLISEELEEVAVLGYD